MGNEKKLKVASDQCIGCGMCVAIADSLFKFNDQNQSVVIKQPENEEEIKKAQDACEACCVGAISYDE